VVDTAAGEVPSDGDRDAGYERRTSGHDKYEHSLCQHAITAFQRVGKIRQRLELRVR
jgi:hypothetical protein